MLIGSGEVVSKANKAQKLETKETARGQLCDWLIVGWQRRNAET